MWKRDSAPKSGDTFGGLIVGVVACVAVLYAVVMLVRWIATGFSLTAFALLVIIGLLIGIYQKMEKRDPS